MKIKTSDLKGPALDYAVAVCEKRVCQVIIKGTVYHDTDYDHIRYNPSSNWSQAGPIIKREGIELYANGTISKEGRTQVEYWSALIPLSFKEDSYYDGDTPLQAAMRCYVASKLGDEVEVPEELL